MVSLEIHTPWQMNTWNGYSFDETVIITRVHFNEYKNTNI